MLSGLRVFICSLCCCMCVLAQGPTSPEEVKAMPAVLDNFDDLIGNENAKQNCIGAAKGVITSGSMSKAHTGKGYWYSYADGESSVTNAAGTLIGTSNFDDLIDPAELFLGAKLIISTSSEEYAYAGIGCDLTVSSEYLDLSKMTALSMKVKGSGTVRVFFKTKDYKGEDWGYYGTSITLSASWTTETIPVDDLMPEEGSIGWEDDWTWEHGASEVGQFHIQTITAEGDADIDIDDITLVGMTYGDFGWVVPVIAGRQTVKSGNILTIGNSCVNYSITRPQHVSLHLFNAMGTRVATLFSGNAETGSHSIPMGNLAGGNYFVRLAGDGHSASVPVTVVK